MKRRDPVEVARAVAEARSAATAIRSLGLINYATLYGLIREHNLDTSHWTGKAHLRGRTHNWSPKTPLAQILVRGSTYRGGTARLKARLCRDGLLSAICANCGIEEWCGQRLALHLDHCNGDRFDNRIENLRLLCPNCHSLTETYCGRNKGRFLNDRNALPKISFLIASAMSGYGERLSSRASGAERPESRDRRGLKTRAKRRRPAEEAAEFEEGSREHVR